jgi:hypothetical protein
MRYVLYTAGSDPAKTKAALQVIGGFNDVQVVHEGASLLLVDIDTKRLGSLLDELPGWSASQEQRYKRPVTGFRMRAR